MRPEAPRLPPLHESEWTPEQRDLLDRGRVGGRVLNIFRTLARHPKLLKRWLVFGNHVLNKSTLPARDREIVILRIGWLCGCEYEWSQHVGIGRSCGLSEEDLARISAGPDAAGLAPRDALLLRATDELHADACVHDATWRALARHYDEAQLIDLIFTVGQYNLVSMALNSLGVPLDEGVPGAPQLAGRRR